ncbi:MAG: NAD(P)H-dependent oxidoreductase [Phycisphaerae bacterium]|nr:NAD(P)H-dependent oxidoreductase [Phycisphaerae bacterium]
MPTPRVLAFSGSLRRGSFNTSLARVCLQGARAAGAEGTLIELREFPLPVFSEDLEREEGLPPSARKLKDLFLSHDALIIASPEYNGSLTAALKNAIDWVSRPATLADGRAEPMQACFDRKLAALVAASPGALGGLRGLFHLRTILSGIRVTVLPDQLAVGKAHEAFNADGTLKDAKQHEAVLAIGAKLANMTAKLM